LLDLCGLPADPALEGRSFAAAARGEVADPDDAVLLTCPHPFGEYTRAVGGREYRGLRTNRHTYVESLDGPWLLYDNHADPFQMENLAGNPGAAGLRDSLSARLRAALAATGDRFERGEDYCARWGYVLDETGTVPYSD
jgi:arylsulfatase A-like enzyme